MAGTMVMSHKLNHVAWSVAIILAVICLVVQMPSVAGVAPVHSSNSALAPITKSPGVLDKSATKTEASLVSKVEETQSQGEKQTQTVIPNWLQNILDAEQTTQQQQPAISVWVPNLAFNFMGYTFDELPFHAQNHAVATNILNDPMRGQTNIVLAEVSVITNTVPRHRVTLPELLPAGGCFKSGAGDLNIQGGTCFGYDNVNVFGNLAAYHQYLMNVVGVPNPIAMHHHHSEQALLAYLYQDSQRCDQNGLQHPACRLGQALQAAGADVGNICTIDAFTLDLISIPNSVCVGCERALHRGDWLHGYSRALNAHCGRVAPNAQVRQRLHVLTSSFNLYQQSFGHVSCAAINHPGFIPNLSWDGIHYDANAPQGVVFHRIPYNSVQDVQARCAQVNQQLI